MAEDDDGMPKPKGPVKDFPPPPKGGKPPAKGPEDFRVGDFRCLRCGAAFQSRTALDKHTEKGHGLET